MAAPREYPDELRERAVRLYRVSARRPAIFSTKSHSPFSMTASMIVVAMSLICDRRSFTEPTLSSDNGTFRWAVWCGESEKIKCLWVSLPTTLSSLTRVSGSEENVSEFVSTALTSAHVTSAQYPPPEWSSYQCTGSCSYSYRNSA